MVGRTGVAGLCIGAALLAGAPPAVNPPVLTAAALYMGGTFGQLSVPEDSPEFISSYVAEMAGTYLDPTGLCTGGHPGCTPLAVVTPEEITIITGWQDLSFDDSVAVGATNLDNCLRGLPCRLTPSPYTATVTTPLTDTAFTVVGYSQSATVATVEKRALITSPPDAAVSLVLLANPNRPNGGILQRFSGAFLPIVGITFSGATPTNSPDSAPLTTFDITGQYDPIADFPTNPLNLLADLNAILGYWSVHLQPFNLGTPELQGQYQDSTYYLSPSTTLPLLGPIAGIPFLGPLLATVLDPPLRVLIESGYDRTINPGAPSGANWFYLPNPITTTLNFLKALPTGWDNGIAYVTDDPANRPFSTAPQPAYGVGGPPVNAGAIGPYGDPTPYTAVVDAAPAPAASIPSTTETTTAVEESTASFSTVHTQSSDRDTPRRRSRGATTAEPARRESDDPKLTERHRQKRSQTATTAIHGD